ncbi:hypothetical protein RCL1_008608 [Eukaryota sp. TZLM3-RCL]
MESSGQTSCPFGLPTLTEIPFRSFPSSRGVSHTFGNPFGNCSGPNVVTTEKTVVSVDEDASKSLSEELSENDSNTKVVVEDTLDSKALTHDSVAESPTDEPPKDEVVEPITSENHSICLSTEVVHSNFDFQLPSDHENEEIQVLSEKDVE